MSAILFAITTYLGWGIGDFLGAFSTKRLGAYSTTLWSNVIWFLIFLPFYPFFFNELQGLSLGVVLILFAVSILDLIGIVAFYEGLKIGPVSLVGAISSSFAALVVVLSIIFLRESIAINQIIAILIIFLGVFFSSLDFKDLKKRNFALTRGVSLALLAMFCWGIGYTFIKIPIKEIGWFWSNAFISLLFPLIYIFMRIRKIKLNYPNYNKAFPFLFGSAVFIAIGGTTFSYALSKGLSSVVAPIAGAYSTLFILLTFVFFKDRITKQQLLGIFTTILGIVLLAIYSA